MLNQTCCATLFRENCMLQFDLCENKQVQNISAKYFNNKGERYLEGQFVKVSLKVEWGIERSC